MEKLIQILIILFAGSSVAIADVMIKKSAFTTHNFWVAFKNPLILGAAFLYIFQIILFIYVFVKRWDLGIVSLMQMIAYAAIVIFAGVFYFHEKYSILQAIGMAMAFIGIILMNA